MPRIWLALLVACSACKPTGLLHATTTYAQTSSDALESLSSAPAITTRICHRRMQLQYLADQVTTPQAPPPTTTWTQPCAPYLLAERTFDSALLVVGSYGVALGAIAKDDDESLKGDLESATKSLVNGVAALGKTPLLAEYKDTLGALGTPIGVIADAVRSNWKMKRLGSLIGKANGPLASTLDKLRAYVEVVRKSQVDATWQSYEVLRATLDPKLVTVMDIVVRDDLDRSRRRLEALARILTNIRDAHAALAEAWRRGEGSSSEARKRVRELRALVIDDLRVFVRVEYQ